MVSVDEELHLEVHLHLRGRVGCKGSEESEEEENEDDGGSVSNEARVALRETGLDERVSDLESLFVLIYFSSVEVLLDS